MKEKRTPLLTRQTMLILSILMESSDPLPGSGLATVSALASGTLYPILIRLEEAKWITSEWEKSGPDGTRARRRLYKVTGLGVRRARQEANEWKPLVERFA